MDKFPEKVIKILENFISKIENEKNFKILINTFMKFLLSDDALKVVSQVMKLREQAGEDSEWLFAENGEYISDNKFDKTIRKLCKELDIPVRSCHKLRKTYCSYLLDSGVDEKLVQEQLRHSDIRTTQNHYHYSVKIENEKLTAINTDCKLGNVI